MSYKIILNNEDIGIVVRKVVTLEEKVDSLLTIDKIPFRTGFFMRGQKGFNSMLFNMAIDLLFLDPSGRVIKAIPGFETNKISKYYENSKTCVILPTNTIEYFNIYEGSHITIIR